VKIILLPGLDGTGRLFTYFSAALDSSVEPVVFTYPDDPGLGYADLIDLVLDFLPKKEPYIILGESFSGPIAIKIAATKPSMLKGVVLVNTFVSCPRPFLINIARLIPTNILNRPPAMVLKIILRKREYDIDPIDSIKEVVSSLTGELIRSRLTAIEAVNVRDITEEIVHPVCLLQSIDDAAIPETSRKLLRRSLQRYEFHQLEVSTARIVEGK